MIGLKFNQASDGFASLRFLASDSGLLIPASHSSRETTRGGDIMDAVFIEACQHPKKDFSSGERVISGAMAIDDGNGEVCGERVQTMIRQVWKDATREFDGAEMRVNHSSARKHQRDFVIEEAHIKV